MPVIDLRAPVRLIDVGRSVEDGSRLCVVVRENYPEYCGDAQMRSVMIFPSDEQKRRRYWLAVARRHVICRGECYEDDEWPIPIQRWEFEALADGEHENVFDKDLADARHDGFCAGHCLQFLIRTHAFNREHCSLGKWEFAFVDEFTVPTEGKAARVKKARPVGLHKLNTSGPSLDAARERFASVAHLWAALLKPDGTELDILEDWDAFIAKARMLQTEGINRGIFQMISGRKDDDDVWLVGDDAANDAEPPPLIPIPPELVAHIDAHYKSAASKSRKRTMERALARRLEVASKSRGGSQ